MLSSRKKVRVRQGISAAGMSVLGFLLDGAIFPMEIAPFGVALTAALPQYSTFALLGVVLRGLLGLWRGDGFPPTVFCAACIYLARVIMGLTLGDRRIMRKTGRLPDAVSTRVLLATVFALGFALFDMIRTGISASAFISLALQTVCAGAFSFLFCFFFEAEYKHTPMFEAGLGALAFALSLSFAKMALGAFSIGVFVAALITFYVGYFGEATRSSAVGLLCGLSLGGVYAPTFALMGLVVGIFFDVNALLAAVSAVAVTIGSALYFGGAALVREILPEVLSASALITIPAMLEILPDFSMKLPVETANAERIATDHRESEREKRMRHFSLSMSSLAEAMHGVSEKLRRPAPEKLGVRCMEVFRAHCKNCPHECSCTGLEALENEKLSAKIASRLMAQGRVDRDRLYEMTKVKCPYLDVIAADLSVCSAKMAEEAIREDTSRIFALDYEAMARMFADAAAEEEVRYPIDRVLSERLHRHLLRAGVEAENVIVCGDRKKFVVATGAKITHMTLRPSDLAEICETVCKTRFSMPEFMIEGGKSAVTLESANVFSVSCAARKNSRAGEDVCGDSVSVLKNYDGYFYGVLCDGMGSGEGAAATAEMCRVFLEKMLACGNGKSTILSMLNTLLGARRTECFATVDMAEIDLVTGEAAFLKSGAVPSFVLRGGKLLRISSDTYPIGIMPKISSEMTCLSLSAGDLVLLCSDGVCSDLDEEEPRPWFARVMMEMASESVDAIAEKILRLAGEKVGYDDDMSVIVMRLEKWEG